MKSPTQVLKKQFGFDEFRFDQNKIIDRVMAGKDTFVLMPTGGGKSLCYQIPALLYDGLTVVISPLIALMKDQVDALRVNGIRAAYLNSSLTPNQQNQVYNLIRKKEIKLLYIAPERLFSRDSEFMEVLKVSELSLIAIDEAHCISQWGHDFRPEYLKLGALKVEFPKIPVIALTATADKLTRSDILEKLNLNNPETFISSFNRGNIHYHIEPKKKSYVRLLDFLEERKEESGIIYTLSRKSTEDLAKRLEFDGFSAKPYNAGLDRKEREHHQELFIKDKVKIIVATIAFGMGIDKSNVRYVVHMNLPKNIESYYQETGRAGRDGLKSDALLFYSKSDLTTLKEFARVDDNSEQSEIMLGKLDQMAYLCEALTCRRKFLLNYFDEEYEGNCESCDICLSDYQEIDGTIIAQKALSAIARLKESYGMNYIIDFLKGSKSKKIPVWQKKIKTYGVGSDHTKEEWTGYLDNLRMKGYLIHQGEIFPRLALTKKSWDILKGREKVTFLKAVGHRQAGNEYYYEKPLFNRLKTVRAQIAEKENTAAFVIFSDATLVELARWLPHNLDELHHVKGFGETKVHRYGQIFLNEIIKYCEENGLNSRYKNIRLEIKAKKSAGARSNTKLETFRLYKEGNSPPDIAQARGLSLSTIENHLNWFIGKGEMSLDELVPADKIPAIRQAITEHGWMALRPLKDALGNRYSYGEIKAVVEDVKRVKD
ncbi:MAG: DNA helicase RecQ [Balneolales bacterium]